MADAPARRRRDRPRNDDTPRKPGLPARRAAARLLGAVVDKRTSLDGLMDDAHGHPDYMALSVRDRSLVRAILLAALRHRNRLEGAIAHRLDRPLPEGARSLSHHLHVGAAQVLLLDIPSHSAIDLAVDAVRADPRAKRFAGLANAVLRRLAREGRNARRWVEAEPSRPPEWLERALVEAYGAERTESILAAHAALPALDVTVKGDPAAWAERLNASVLPTGTLRTVAGDGAVTALPGFADGEWWVQDAAAALPAQLLSGSGVAPERVLDLCAAPGGKTAQLAAMGAEVTAVEINPNRARRLGENLARLNLTARIVEGDASNLTADDLGAPFDAVLLDAPCSSTGTIRRHPDVAWTKTGEDVAKLADLQSRLLARAAELVAPGGRLVFANCSILPAEGEAVSRAFLAARPDFQLDPIDPAELGDPAATSPMVAPEGWLRTTPDMLPHEEPRLAGLDGFHAARFVRSG